MPGGANRGSAGKVLQDCYTLQQATIDLRRLLRRALPGERAGPRPATLHQLLALHRVVRQALERLDVRGRIATSTGSTTRSVERGSHSSTAVPRPSTLSMRTWPPLSRTKP